LILSFDYLVDICRRRYFITAYQHKVTTKPMRSFIILFFLTALSANINAQKNTASRGRHIIGRMVSTENTIESPVLYAKNEITEAHVVPEKSVLVLSRMLPQTKYLSIAVHELEKDSLIWEDDILSWYGLGHEVTPNHIICNTETRSVMVKLRSGDRHIKPKYNFNHFPKNGRIGLSFPRNRANPMVFGVDIVTGKKVWQRKIIRDYDWSILEYQDSLTMIGLGGGLTQIDLRTGKGWNYFATTGDRGFAKKFEKKKPNSNVELAIVLSMVGIAAAAVLGVGFIVIPTTIDAPHDVKDIAHVHSNLAKTETHYFFASKERLAKIKQSTGEMDWFMSFPEKTASHSQLKLNEKQVWMTNFGSVLVDGQWHDYGKPFVAAYHTETGDLIFWDSTLHKTPIKDSKLFGSDLSVVTDTHLIKYNPAGKILLHTPLDTSNLQNPVPIGEKIAYTVNQDVAVTQLPDSLLHILTSSQKVASFDSEHKIVDSYHTDELAWKWLSYRDYQILYRTTSPCLLVDQFGAVISTLSLDPSATIQGDYLVNIKDGTEVSWLNLAELVK
jgi:hypothetical protein